MQLYCTTCRTLVKPDRQAARRAETEARLISAASELFVQRGYAATTLADVAEQAGLAPRTLYLRFSTKAELLRRCIGAAIVGDTAPVPLSDRDWLTAAMTAPTLQDRIAQMAAVTAQLMHRTGPLLDVARQAAAVDAEIAATAQAGREDTRRALLEFWQTRSRRPPAARRRRPGLAQRDRSAARPGRQLPPAPSHHRVGHRRLRTLADHHLAPPCTEQRSVHRHPAGLITVHAWALRGTLSTGRFRSGASSRPRWAKHLRQRGTPPPIPRRNHASIDRRHHCRARRGVRSAGRYGRRPGHEQPEHRADRTVQPRLLHAGPGRHRRRSRRDALGTGSVHGVRPDERCLRRPAGGDVGHAAGGPDRPACERPEAARGLWCRGLCRRERRRRVARSRPWVVRSPSPSRTAR